MENPYKSVQFTFFLYTIHAKTGECQEGFEAMNVKGWQRAAVD